MPPAGADASRSGARRTVPLAEAKNQLSALVARVERGEEIAISRRGIPVVRLVPDAERSNGQAGREARVDGALERLRQLRSELSLEGDLRLIARDGFD